MQKVGVLEEKADNLETLVSMYIPFYCNNLSCFYFLSLSACSLSLSACSLTLSHSACSLALSLSLSVHKQVCSLDQVVADIASITRRLTVDSQGSACLSLTCIFRILTSSYLSSYDLFIVETKKSYGLTLKIMGEAGVE